jgi:hypothetical protein
VESNHHYALDAYSGLLRLGLRVLSLHYATTC